MTTEAGSAPATGWSIPVASSVSKYPVRVGRGVLGELGALAGELAPAHKYAVIADHTVWGHHAGAIERACASLPGPFRSHTFPAGEPSKSRSEWARLTDILLGDGLGRDACLIAVGGGVAGDLVGFVAATYMRGIPVVQVPTSLVAMVDASVGGKTAVDVPSGKNLVGAFHPPAFVLADTDLSTTLPRRERSQGMAEAVKHGAILDAAYLEAMEASAGALLDGEPDATAAMVARSVEIKAHVVSEDEREGGLRQVLNFGHTLGHALEAASDYRLPHGDAVAIGMVLEARLGEKLGVTEAGVAERLEDSLRRFQLPTGVVGGEKGTDIDLVVSLTTKDKKVRGGAVRYVLLSKVGAVAPGDGWSTPVDEAPVRAVLAEALESGR